MKVPKALLVAAIAVMALEGAVIAKLWRDSHISAMKKIGAAVFPAVQIIAPTGYVLSVDDAGNAQAVSK